MHLKLKLYKCSACSHTSYLRKALQIHVKSKHKDGTCRIIKIGCSPCENNLAHEFCERSKKHKPQNGKFHCTDCDFTSNLENLNFHNEAVHMKIKRYKCSACLHASYSRQALQSHVKSKHKDETCRIIKIGCSPCETNLVHEFCERKRKSKKYKNKNYNGKFKCSECDFTSNQEKSLTCHNEAIHMNIKRFYCKSCRYTTYYQHNMKSHIDKYHKSASNQFGSIGCDSCENTDGCSECLKSFPQIKKKRLKKTIRRARSKRLRLNE